MSYENFNKSRKNSRNQAVPSKISRGNALRGDTTSTAHVSKVSGLRFGGVGIF